MLMPNTLDPAGLNALKMEFSAIIGSSARVSAQLSDAINDVLTALGYEDQPLLEASFTSLHSSLSEVARDIIQKAVKASEAIKETIKKGWREHVDGVACEDFDELKNLLESLIDERIANMTRIQANVVAPLAKNGVQVENAQQLEESIRDLRKFRADIIKDWPVPNKRPSPVNRKSISDARVAIRRGDYGMRKEELTHGNPPAASSDRIA